MNQAGVDLLFFRDRKKAEKQVTHSGIVTRGYQNWLFDLFINFPLPLEYPGLLEHNYWAKAFCCKAVIGLKSDQFFWLSQKSISLNQGMIGFIFPNILWLLGFSSALIFGGELKSTSFYISIINGKILER